MTYVAASDASVHAHARFSPCMRCGSAVVPKGTFWTSFARRSGGLGLVPVLCRRRNQPQPQDRGCCDSRHLRHAGPEIGSCARQALPSRAFPCGGAALLPSFLPRIRRPTIRTLPAVSIHRQMVCRSRCESRSRKGRRPRDCGWRGECGARGLWLVTLAPGRLGHHPAGTRTGARGASLDWDRFWRG
jgi:hypothetical protein